MNDTSTKQVFLYRGNKIAGPFTRRQIRDGLTKGKLKLTDSFSLGKEGKQKKLERFYLDEKISHSLKTSWGLKRHSVSYRCPNCDAPLRSKLQEAGRKDNCPDCGIVFIVPGKHDKTELLGDKNNKPLATQKGTEPRYKNFQAWLAHRNLNIEELKADQLAKQQEEWRKYRGKHPSEDSGSERSFGCLGPMIKATLGTVVVAVLLYFAASFGVGSIASLQAWLPEGTSVARVTFVAGLLIPILPYALPLAFSPILVILVIIADEKVNDGGLMGAWIAFWIVCTVIGVALMLLAIPIWLIELFI